jgi:PAS domain S-box-containing protein
MTECLIAAIPSTVQDPAERGRQLFEDAPIAYHEIDIRGIIREVNQAECRLLGYCASDLIGHPIWEFVAMEQQQAARDAIAGKVTRQQPVSVVTRVYRRADGSYLWLEIHEKLIQNTVGEVVGIRSALLDVTERRKLEAEIVRQRDWMRFVVRSAAKAIVTADALGNVNMMNPAAEAMTGWREQEALRRPLEQVCRVQTVSGEPVDLMSCILAETVVPTRQCNFMILGRTGETRPIQWMISAISNDDDVIVGATLVVEEQ